MRRAIKYADLHSHFEVDILQNYIGMSIERQNNHEKEQMRPPFSLPEDSEKNLNEISRNVMLPDGITILTSRLQRKFLDTIWYSSKADPISHFQLSEQLKYYPTEIVTEVHKRDRIKHIRHNLNNKFTDGQISLRIDQKPHAFEGKRLISSYYMNRFELENKQEHKLKPTTPLAHTPDSQAFKQRRTVKLIHEMLPDTANSVRAFLQVSEKTKTAAIVLTNEEYTILEMLFERNGQMQIHTMLLHMESKYDLRSYQSVAKAVTSLDEKVRQWMYSVQTEHLKSEGIQLLKLTPFNEELYKKPIVTLPTPLDDDKKLLKQRGPRVRNSNPDESDFRD